MAGLRFYTDTHIDKQAAIQLRLRGMEVIRCQDVGMANVSDETHLIYACERQLVVITKDADFRQLHYQWLLEDKKHYGIFYCSDRQISAVGKIVTACDTYNQLLVSGVATTEDFINHFFEIC